MIEDFVVSWELFGATYLTGWFIAATLAIAGIPIVARDQIFVGAAIAQASTLGIAATLFLGSWAAAEWIEHPATATVGALSCSLAASLLSARAGSQRGLSSPEALSGWIFLAAGSAALLLVASSPHDIEAVERLLVSSLIGATEGEAVLFGGLAVVSIAIVTVRWRSLLVHLTQPEFAVAIGIREATWRYGIATWLGLVIGLALQSSGLLYTFGVLVLPALAARTMARRARTVLWLAPTIAVTGTILGFVAANWTDRPLAQVSVFVLAALWPLAALLGAIVTRLR